VSDDDRRLSQKRRELKRLMTQRLGYKLNQERETYSDTRLMAADYVRALERHRLPKDIERQVDKWPEAHLDSMLQAYGAGSPRYVW
jgi:hypothetical protein